MMSRSGGGVLSPGLIVIAAANRLLTNNTLLRPKSPAIVHGQSSHEDANRGQSTGKGSRGPNWLRCRIVTPPAAGVKSCTTYTDQSAAELLDWWPRLRRNPNCWPTCVGRRSNRTANNAVSLSRSALSPATIRGSSRASPLRTTMRAPSFTIRRPACCSFGPHVGLTATVGACCGPGVGCVGRGDLSARGTARGRTTIIATTLKTANDLSGYPSLEFNIFVTYECFPDCRHVGMANCGTFNSSPSFLADSLATTPATVMFNASATFTIGVRLWRMAVTNSFISCPSAPP